MAGEPRLAPITDEECSPEQREMLDGLGPTGDLNIFRTLVRHPKLFRRWGPFGGYLLQRSTFAPRERELIILRAAARSDASYEWGQHVAIARDAGLSDDEIRAVGVGPDAASWSNDDATLLRAVDELADDHGIGDATWTALAGRLDEQQLIELGMLAGHYMLLAGVLRSLGVQPERELPAIGEA